MDDIVAAKMTGFRVEKRGRGWGVEDLRRGGSVRRKDFG